MKYAPAIFLLAAVVFMCFAAFKMTWGADTVVWFDLSWASALAALLAWSLESNRSRK